MRYLQLTLAGFCMVLVASVTMAQNQKAEKPMDPQGMMEVYAKLATPGEPHKLFASLAGSWTTKTKEWMEPNKPPMESTGTAEMKMLLGGRFLYQEFNGNMMGKPFSGIGIDGYDNLRKKYVTAWIDTMGTGIFGAHPGPLEREGGTTFTFVTGGIETALELAMRAASGEDMP
ncbi:MAG: DUF1579 domain-containing protein [Gammaproteobacteria bacterium]